MPTTEWMNFSLQRFRRTIGLSQHWLGYHLGVSVRTVRLWEARNQIPQRKRSRLQRLLDQHSAGRRITGAGTYGQPGRPLKNPLHME